MDCAAWILLRPLMLIVEVCDAMSTKSYLISEEH